MVGRRMNIRLVIGYDGGAYSGWQYQPRQRTIQGELQKAIERLTSRKVTLTAAGRTDTGVHAAGQVANFNIVHDLPVQKYREGLNFYLPDDILVYSADEAPSEFNARYDAIWREYHYHIGLEPSALNRHRCWTVGGKLDETILTWAADGILGRNDFSAFCVARSLKKSNSCVIYKSRWRRTENGFRFEIAADRYLHSMIRYLVGMMVGLAQGEFSRRQFRAAVLGNRGQAAKKPAPAQGLCLAKVMY